MHDTPRFIHSLTLRNLAPQTKTVLRHLLRNRSISNVEANAVHKIRALPRRIADLREAFDLDIKREWRRDDTGQRYVAYSLRDSDRSLLIELWEELYGSTQVAA